VDEMRHKIDRMASENQRLYSVNQSLIEETKLLAIDHQHLWTVHEQLDLVMAGLDRYTDSLEMVNQRRADHCSTVCHLMGKLSSSRKTAERLTAQFNLTLGQQNKRIEKLRATLSQTCLYEPSGFWQTGDESRRPWEIIFSQKQR
jgi:histidyl-tRNA synthetase